MKKIFVLVLALTLSLILTSCDFAALGQRDFVFEENDDGTYTVTGGARGAEEIVIPETYNGKPVTGIAENAFRDRTGLKSLTIPIGILSIGMSAFEGCLALREINFNATAMLDTLNYSCVFQSAGYDTDGITVNVGANVTRIPGYIFYSDEISASGCGGARITPNILAVNFAEGSACEEIGDHAFDGCARLAGIALPSGLEKIGYAAFGSCSSLTSLNIPASVTEIGHYAFERCTSVESVMIESRIASIGEGAFRDCKALGELSLGGITDIGNEAFARCSALKEVVLPDGIRSIGDMAFRDCTSLACVKIGRGLARYGDRPFLGCSALVAFTVSEENGKYLAVDGNLYSRTAESAALVQYAPGKSETEFAIPIDVDLIEGCAFCSASKLVSVIVPAGVSEIRWEIFEDCNSIRSLKYRGSEQAWSEIEKWAAWKPEIEGFEIIFDYSGSPDDTVIHSPFGDDPIDLPLLDIEPDGTE